MCCSSLFASVLHAAHLALLLLLQYEASANASAFAAAAAALLCAPGMG
jgi:hypothetical protein